MRIAAKVDGNQAEIVDALRKIGCSVQPLHMVGKGCPDLLVGISGRTYPVEIKNGSKLTDAQVKWHRSWRGGVWVLNSVDDALMWAASMKSDSDGSNWRSRGAA